MIHVKFCFFKCFFNIICMAFSFRTRKCRHWCTFDIYAFTYRLFYDINGFYVQF